MPAAELVEYMEVIATLKNRIPRCGGRSESIGASDDRAIDIETGPIKFELDE